VLESLGIRFLGVGGTSAGAVNAAMLSGLGTPAEAKSHRTPELLAELDMYSFVDGDEDARDIIDARISDSKSFKLTPEAKVDLFARGASAATIFLRGFDWAAYKVTRAEMQRT